jgi:hypothetical protein
MIGEDEEVREMLTQRSLTAIRLVKSGEVARIFLVYSGSGYVVSGSEDEVGGEMPSQLVAAGELSLDVYDGSSISLGD